MRGPRTCFSLGGHQILQGRYISGHLWYRCRYRSGVPPTDPNVSNHAARLERFRALADPTRLSILEALRIRDQLTTTELGRLMPHAKGSMRHHLKVLASAGLIKPVSGAAWVEASPDALMVETSGASQDAEEAVVMRLLDYIVKHRRVGRIERWERDRKEGKWPQWAENDLGRDYVVKMTVAELTALDQALNAVVADHREQASRRRDQKGLEGEELVFLTLLGFPFALGE